jgi:hypothetical protein
LCVFEHKRTELPLGLFETVIQTSNDEIAPMEQLPRRKKQACNNLNREQPNLNSSSNKKKPFQQQSEQLQHPKQPCQEEQSGLLVQEHTYTVL